MFEGIPCWPKLPNLFKPLKEHGVNVTAVVYAPAFGFVYNNMDEMVRAYYKAPQLRVYRAGRGLARRHLPGQQGGRRAGPL